MRDTEHTLSLERLRQEVDKACDLIDTLRKQNADLLAAAQAVAKWDDEYGALPGDLGHGLRAAIAKYEEPTDGR